MEKEELRVRTPFIAAGITLVPIVKISTKHWHSKGRLSFLATEQPVSIVMVSPQARKAFHIDGEEVPLDQLTKEVPGIEEKLEGM